MRRHSALYERVMRSDRWKRIRELALIRANYRCQGCGVSNMTARLEGHHWKGYGMLGRELPGDIQILCQYCHQRAHGGRVMASRWPRRLRWCALVLIVWAVLWEVLRYLSR
jgi:5-methylcytosine-specific restriction endonuclease McrA